MSDGPTNAYEFVMIRARDAAADHLNTVNITEAGLAYLVEAILSAVDDLVIEARCNDDYDWPDEGDLMDDNLKERETKP